MGGERGHALHYLSVASAILSFASMASGRFLVHKHDKDITGVSANCCS